MENVDFEIFDSLPESQKGRIARNWDRNMRIKYLNRHSAMTEEEFFTELDRIANETNASDCQSEEFSFLDNLDEESKIEIMKNWDKSTWINFCMQNTVSEHDVFDPIFKLIEEDNN